MFNKLCDAFTRLLVLWVILTGVLGYLRPASLVILKPHLGVILVGSVPGAMASNVISYLAKADVAYSIALTSTSTVLSPVLAPAFTYLFGHTFIEIRFWPMFFSIIKMVILPLFASWCIITASILAEIWGRNKA